MGSPWPQQGGHRHNSLFRRETNTVCEDWGGWVWELSTHNILHPGRTADRSQAATPHSLPPLLCSFSFQGRSWDWGRRAGVKGMYWGILRLVSMVFFLPLFPLSSLWEWERYRLEEDRKDRKFPICMWMSYTWELQTFMISKEVWKAMYVPNTFKVVT